MHDERYPEALAIVLSNNAASSALLQKELKIGYARAMRLLDVMEDEGLIGPPNGGKPRTIYTHALQARISAPKQEVSFWERNKKTMTWGIVIICAWFVFFAWPHKDEWSGEGEISAFPEGASVKNYRLDAQMEVVHYRKGWQHDRFEAIVTSAQWPNGGTLDFYDCRVKEGSRANCVSSAGDSYSVEVTEFPPAPENDSYDDYGY